MDPLPAGGRCAMAPAYRLSGSVHSAFTGTYSRLEVAEHGQCQHKPLYQLGGSSGPVLYQPEEPHQGWLVGRPTTATATASGSGSGASCPARGYITSASSWVVEIPAEGDSPPSQSTESSDCMVEPAGAGCASRWREAALGGAVSCGGGETAVVGSGSTGGLRWCPQPAIAIEAVACAPNDACCGLECGEHGSCVAGHGGGVGNSHCSCTDGYMGARCEMAPAYQLSGASLFGLRGSYYPGEAALYALIA